VISLHVNISSVTKEADMNIGNKAKKTYLQTQKQIYKNFHIKDVRIFYISSTAFHMLFLLQYLSFVFFTYSCFLYRNLQHFCSYRRRGILLDCGSQTQLNRTFMTKMGVCILQNTLFWKFKWGN
jgi:hypothetical protein